MTATKTEIKEDDVFVFTTKGDIIDLPYGATVLDFAFAVHTDLGIYFNYAKVNGETVGIDYVLKNGDRIKIITGNESLLSPSWLTCVITGKAKNIILKYK